MRPHRLIRIVDHHHHRPARVAMAFTDSAILGSTRTITDEGYLVCRDAVLARTGSQIYHATELPDIQADANGVIVVDRPEAEVFDPAAIASFAGKPMTVEHPADLVGVDNYREHAIGHVANPRRGDPPRDNVLVGDLVVVDARAIRLIRTAGWRALSAGYTASYDQITPGFAVQRGIRGNHVALLRNGEARCGPVCAIGDAAPRRRSVAAMSSQDFDKLIAHIKAKRRRSRDEGELQGERASDLWPPYNFSSLSTTVMGEPHPAAARVAQVQSATRDALRAINAANKSFWSR